MIRIGLSPFKRRPPAGGYSAEATALFARATVLGSSFPDADKPYVDAAITYLKSTGQWDLLDCIPKFDVHSKTAALIDWKDPSRSFTIVNDYAGSFTSYQGFTPNSTNFRIALGVNFGDGGTYNYTRNSALIGFYINTHDSFGSKTDMSASTVANNDIAMVLQNNVTPKKILPVINSGSHSFVKLIVQSYGWHFAQRTGSASFTSLKNGQDPWSTFSGTTASTAVVNLPITLFARAINNTTFSAYSGRAMKGCVFGSGAADPQYITNGLNIYSLGVNSVPKSCLIVSGNSFSANGDMLNSFYGNYSGSNTVADFTRATPGIETTDMITDFPNTLAKIRVTGYTKKCFWIQELTNDMAYNGSDVDYCYDNIVTMIGLGKAAFGNDCTVFVSTCLPRGGTSPIVEANRENPLNANDVTTVNGKLRVNAASLGIVLIDWGSDIIMGVANAYTNPTYYNTADEIHPTTTGYTYLDTNYNYPIISPYL